MTKTGSRRGSSSGPGCPDGEADDRRSPNHQGAGGVLRLRRAHLSNRAGPGRQPLMPAGDITEESMQQS
jgi:hypothetical protein